MKRIYHPYYNWEEFINGMWSTVTPEHEQELLEIAIDFTGDADVYGKYMIQVVEKWKISCEHNLSNKNMNRQAWIGHAAACLAKGIPEYITRRAWHFLTTEQQDKANAKANYAISLWEGNHEENVRY